MRLWVPFLCAFVLFGSVPAAIAQSSALRMPATVQAGTALSIPTSGAGAATLYIVGPDDSLQRKFQLGETVELNPNDLHHAGHYIAILTGKSLFQSAQFDVVASPAPARISFLAKPARLPVNVPDGISGVAYVFDVFGNLILQPQQVLFELSDSSGRVQSRNATTHGGVAWVKLNSAARAGSATLLASVGGVREKRVVQEVAGEPCSLKMSAKPDGQKLVLETAPVVDCNGNPVPDGTIVTFTETYGDSQSTVDVPLKRGVARTELPARKGAVISAASGVVMGNEIHWNGGL